MKSLTFFFAVILSFFAVDAQLTTKAVATDIDTLIKVGFPTLTITAEREFYDDYVREEYYRVKTLNRDVARVVPFAQEASRILTTLDSALNGVEKRKERKAILNASESAIQLKIDARLQSLTRQQGEILVKLVHRETEQTVHSWLKSIKGKASAFYMQNLARAGGVNLKLEFNAEAEDRQIEKIIERIDS